MPGNSDTRFAGSRKGRQPNLSDDTELVGKISNDENALYNKQIQNFVNWCDKITCILMFLKLKRCVLTLKRIKDVPNQATLKEKQWRGYKYIDT